MTDVNHQGDIEELRGLLSQITDYGTSWKPDESEYVLWFQRVKNLLRRAYVDGETRISELDEAATYQKMIRVHRRGSNEPSDSTSLDVQEFRANIPRLTAHVTALRTDLIQRSKRAVVPLNIFVAHGGPSKSRTKLEQFLRAINANPIIVELEAGGASSPSRKVDTQLDRCHFAVILATGDRGAVQDGRQFPRANVINEISRVRAKLGDRSIILLEKGVSLPSNESDWTWPSFTQESMDEALIAVATELRVAGFLVASIGNKPE